MQFYWIEDSGMSWNEMNPAKHEPIKDVMWEIAMELYGMKDGGMY